jgi:hypothetical protein
MSGSGFSRTVTTPPSTPRSQLKLMYSEMSSEPTAQRGPQIGHSLSTAAHMQMPNNQEISVSNPLLLLTGLLTSCNGRREEGSICASLLQPPCHHGGRYCQDLETSNGNYGNKQGDIGAVGRNMSWLATQSVYRVSFTQRQENARKTCQKRNLDISKIRKVA